MSGLQEIIKVVHKIKTIIAGSCLLLGGQTLAYSSDQISLFSSELNLGMELFRWQEFETDNSKILEEKGPRVFLTLRSTNVNNIDSRFIRDISIKAYAGVVAYDGRTQPADGNVPVETDTNYSGWNIELKLGYRSAGYIHNNIFDFIAGVGIDSWERDIESGSDANGAAVSGLIEEYRIAYARLGLGMLHEFEKWNGYFEGGVKRPFETDEDVIGITLSPKERLSLYFSYKIIQSKYGQNSYPFITFYYDSFRFSQSSPEVLTGTSNIIIQPESHMDIVGVTIGRAF